MSGFAGELHERIGQALTALRANAAFLLKRSADRPELQAAARDVEAQGAAIDRDLRRLLGVLPAPAAPPEERPRLAGVFENWQDADGRGGCALDVDPPDLRLSRDVALTLYRMTQHALDLLPPPAAGRPGVSVRVDADAATLAWSVTDAAGRVCFSARLPLGGEGGR